MTGIITWPRRDYAAWVALGEGGIAHSTAGWCLVTCLRLLSKLGSVVPRRVPPGSTSALADIPFRGQARPRVAPHPIPHRELTGSSTPKLLNDLTELVLSERQRHASQAVMALSKYEKHFEGLYVPRTRELGVSRTGEIVHVHRPQGSLHVQLSDADALTVYERGWGELHPLAFLGRVVPRTWCLLYHPRDADEFRVVARIVSTTVDWACSL
jgi:Family of unknown function (DUF5519)